MGDDSSGYEGPPVLLFAVLWLNQSGAKSSPLCSHMFMLGVRDLTLLSCY